MPVKRHEIITTSFSYSPVKKIYELTRTITAAFQLSSVSEN